MESYSQRFTIKKTDQKQYLHYKSSHPKNQKDAQILRGYPNNILLTALNRAWSKTQIELLKPSTKKEDKRIRPITTYNQRNPPMKAISITFVGHMVKCSRGSPI